MWRLACLAVLVACSDTSAKQAGPCDDVAAHFTNLATAAADDPDEQSVLPLLSKLEPQIRGECAASWSEQQRSCFLAATDPAVAVACVPAEPKSAATDQPPATVASDSAGTPAAVASTESSCHTPDGQLLACTHRVASGNRPKSVRFTPDGAELWVALHYDDPAVAIYDAKTWQLISSVDLGEFGAVEIDFSHDGKRAYVSQLETASVYEIDVYSRAVLRHLETHSESSKVVAVSADDQTLFVANWDGHQVTELDLASGEIRRAISFPGIPRGLFATSDGRWLYVTGFDPGKIYKVDLETGRATSIYDKGGAVRHIVGDEARGRLYLSDMGQYKILVVDLATDAVSVLARTDPKPNTIALSPDGRVLFVSNRGRNNPQSFLDAGPQWGSIQVVDTATGELFDGIVTGNQATGLDISPDGTTLAGSDFLDNRINVYRVPSSDELAAGGGGRGVAYKKDLAKPGWHGQPDEAKHNPQLLKKKERDLLYPDLRYSPPPPAPRPPPS